MTGDRYRTAARAYAAYGLVYLLGGVYLVWHGVGAGGAPGRGRLADVVFWTVAGLVPLLVIPSLLGRRRPRFERWVLSRRDFARLLALLLAFRAYKVGQTAVASQGGAVPAPWGGTISFQAGAIVFLAVTLAALVAVARAAWSEEAG